MQPRTDIYFGLCIDNLSECSNEKVEGDKKSRNFLDVMNGWSQRAAERERGALRQCFCCFFCCCCWASSDSKKPEVEGGAAGKGSGKSWWPPSLSQLALMAQVAKMAGKVFKKNKKEEGPKIEEIFS